MTDPLARRLGGGGGDGPVVVDHRPREDAPPDTSQRAKRRRRQTHQSVVYTADFDLVAEVFDLIDPAAPPVKSRARFTMQIDTVTTAVHKLTVTVHEMLAASDARRAAAHLPLERRERAVRLLVSQAVRPERPEIPEHGTAWVTALTASVGPYSAPLAELLGRARLPGTLRGQLSASEKLVEALRGLDAAVAALDRAVKRQKFLARELTPKPAGDPVAEELARLGVDR